MKSLKLDQLTEAIQSLSTENIYQKVQDVLANLTDEQAWMKALRALRAKLMFRWIWQDANQLTDVVTLTRELSDFADACICVAKDFARKPLIAIGSRVTEFLDQENSDHILVLNGRRAIHPRFE